MPADDVPGDDPSSPDEPSEPRKGVHPLDWDNLPERFTSDIVRHLSIANLRRLRAKRGELTQLQRDTFDEAYAEVWSPVFNAYRDIKVSLPEFPKVDLGVDFRKLQVAMPKLPDFASLQIPRIDLTPRTQEILAGLADDFTAKLAADEGLADESPLADDSDSILGQSPQTIETFLRMVTMMSIQNDLSSQIRDLLTTQTRIAASNTRREAQERLFGQFISVVFVATLVATVYPDFSAKKLGLVTLWTVLLAGGAYLANRWMPRNGRERV